MINFCAIYCMVYCMNSLILSSFSMLLFLAHTLCILCHPCDLRACTMVYLCCHSKLDAIDILLVTALASILYGIHC